ncbi:uncharacterized protein DMAD_05833 [Drosophila madeirensis]|uniref:Uncharacterized protein n=1 Tax=Drosophila madeirensis TaxID=30013 RepID=A0AAU9FPD4_DROMD
MERLGITYNFFLGYCSARGAHMTHPMHRIQAQTMFVFIAQQSIEDSNASIDAALAQDAPTTSAAMLMMMMARGAANAALGK